MRYSAFAFAFAAAAGCFRHKSGAKISGTTTTAFHGALCRSKLSTLALNLLAQLNEVYTWLIYAKCFSYLRRTFRAATPGLISSTFLKLS